MAKLEDMFGLFPEYKEQDVGTYKPSDPMAEMVNIIKQREASSQLKSKQVEAQNKAAFDTEIIRRTQNWSNYEKESLFNIEKNAGVKLEGEAKVNYLDGLYKEHQNTLKSDKRYTPLREYFVANSIKPSDMAGIEAERLASEAKLLKANSKKASEGTNPIRGAADMALSLGQGVLGGFKSLTDLAGASNVVSDALDSGSKFLEKGKDDYTLSRTKFHAEAIKKAEESGDLQAEASAILAKLYDQSGDTIAQGIGSFAPNLLLGLITGGVGTAASLGITAAKYGKLAPYFLKAAQAAPQVALGLAQGVGSIKGSQYEQTFNNAKAKGLSDDEAKALADNASEYSAANAGQQALGGALGLVAGATGPIEGAIAKVFTKKAVEAGAEKVAADVAKKGLLNRTATGFATEAITEGAQGGQERYAGNLGAISQGVLDPSKSMRGVVGQGLSEGIVGGVIGGGISATNIGNGSAKPATDPTIDPVNTEPPPQSPLTAKQRADIRATYAVDPEKAKQDYADLTGQTTGQTFDAVQRLNNGTIDILKDKVDRLLFEYLLLPKDSDVRNKSQGAYVAAMAELEALTDSGNNTALQQLDSETAQQFESLVAEPTIDNDAAKTIYAEASSGFDDKNSPIVALQTALSTADKATLLDGLTVGEDKDAATISAKVDDALGFIKAAASGKGNFSNYTEAEFAETLVEKLSYIQQVNETIKADDALLAKSGAITRTAAAQEVVKASENQLKAAQQTEAQKTAADAKVAKEAEALVKKQEQIDALTAKKDVTDKGLAAKKQAAQDAKATKKLEVIKTKEKDAAELAGTRFIRGESQADANERLSSYAKESGKSLDEVVKLHAANYIKATGQGGKNKTRDDFSADTAAVIRGEKPAKPTYEEAREAGLNDREASAVSGIRLGKESEAQYNVRAKDALKKYEDAIAKKGSTGKPTPKQLTENQQAPVAKPQEMTTAQLKQRLQQLEQNSKNEVNNDNTKPNVDAAKPVDTTLPAKQVNEPTTNNPNSGIVQSNGENNGQQVKPTAARRDGEVNQGNGSRSTGNATKESAITSSNQSSRLYGELGYDGKIQTADSNGRRVRGASESSESGLAVRNAVERKLAERLLKSIKTLDEALQLSASGNLSQIKENVGRCIQLSASASHAGLGNMVFGLTGDGNGNTIWHAVVEADGYIYDATLKKWFAPNVYESLNFEPKLSLSPQQVRDYTEANNGLAPSPYNQGLTKEKGESNLSEYNASPTNNPNPSVAPSSSSPVRDGNSVLNTSAQSNTGRKAVVQPSAETVQPKAKADLAPIPTTAPDIRAKQEAASAKLRKKRMQAAANALKPFREKSPFLGWLLENGVKKSEQSEWKDFNPSTIVTGPLFRKRGYPLDLLHTKAIEDGYLSQDSSVDDLYNLISLQASGARIDPLYTEDGATNVMAEAEARNRAEYEDYLAEANNPSNTILTDLDFIPDDLEVSGYNDLSRESQAKIQALLATANSLGIDADLILENVQYETTGKPDELYYTEAIKQLIEVIATGNASGSQNVSEQSQASNQNAEALTAPTRADVLAQQAQRDAEAKRREQGGDAPLPTRKVTADTPDMFNTQGSVFDVPQQSQSNPTTNPSNPTAIRTAIESIFGGIKDAWARISKSTVVVDTVADLPEFAEAIGTNGQAFFVPSKVKGEQGKIYLIADRITKGQEASVWLHEVFHKRGEELLGNGDVKLGKENLKKLYDNVQGWKTRKPDSSGKISVERQIYEAAHKRATDAATDADGNVDKKIYNDEFLTYAIEEANNLGIKPDAKKGTITAAGWLAKVKALFTAALRKLTGVASDINLSASDLMAMAYGAAKLEYEGKTAGAQGDGIQFSKLSDTANAKLRSAKTLAGRAAATVVDIKTPEGRALFKQGFSANFRGASNLARRASIGLFGLREIANYYESSFKKDGKNLLNVITDINTKKGGEVVNALGRLDKVILKDFAALDAVTREALGKLLHLSKVAQYNGSDIKTAISPEAKQIKADYNALPQAAKNVYKKVLAEHGSQWDRYSAEVVKSLTDLGTDVVSVAKIKKELADNKMQVYSAEQRFGNYVVSATENGVDVFFRRYESTAQAEKESKQLQKDNPTWKVTKPTAYENRVKPKFNSATESFIVSVQARLKEKGKSEDEIKLVAETLYGALESRLVKKTEEMMAKRKGIQGADTDMLRSTISSMKKMEQLISATRNNAKLSKAIGNAKKHVDDQKYNDKYDSIEAGQVIQAFEKSIYYAAQESPMQTAVSYINSAGFVATMALNVSSGLVNASGILTMLTPQLTAGHGAKAFPAIAKAMNDVAWKFTTDPDKLTGDMKIVTDYAISIGKLQYGEAREILDVASGLGTTASAAMEIAGRPMAWAEKLVNLTALLASYRLNIEKGAKNESEIKAAKADPAKVEAALEKAKNDMNRSNFDNSSINKGALAKTPAGRVLLMLKGYGFSMTMGMMADVKKVLDSKNTFEEKKFAAKHLVGILSAHAIISGMTGLPYILTAVPMLIASGLLAAFGDDDDDRETSVIIKEAIYEVFGKDKANYIYHGLVGEGLSGRISLDNLVIRARMDGADNKKIADDWLNQILGAGIGNTKKTIEQSVQLKRELETLPTDIALKRFAQNNPVSAIANFAKGATLFEDNGIKYGKDGRPINDIPVSNTAMLFQMLGVRPEVIANAQTEKSTAQVAISSQNKKKQHLLEMYNALGLEVVKGNAGEEQLALLKDLIQLYNDKNPNNEITEKVLSNRLKKLEENVDDEPLSFIKEKDVDMVTKETPWIFAK